MRVVDDAAVRAFESGDREALRKILDLPPHMVSPLDVNHVPPTHTVGYAMYRASLALRQRLELASANKRRILSGAAVNGV